VKSLKTIGEFLKSSLGLLVLGFVLTTVCGGILNGIYSRTSWQRDKRFELLKSELVDDDKLLSDLTKIIGERTFLLQRVLWQMDPPESAPPPEIWSLDPKAREELNARWAAYYETVKEWNIEYRVFNIKIRALAGNDMAQQFIFFDPVNGAREASEGTFCGAIEGTHKVVADLREKALATGQVVRSQHDVAQAAIDHLYDAGENFIQQLYDVLRKKEQSDNPFKTVHPAY
jgi:hypothetical protein